MEGHISQIAAFSRARRFAPAAFLALGLLAGCTTAQLRPSPDEPNRTVAADTAKGKRMPKPETCVACAEMRVQSAANPQRTPLQVEQLRDEARRAYQQALRIDE